MATHPARRFAPIALILALSLATHLPAAATTAAEGIHVTGRGVIETVPDMATVNLRVRREGNDPAALEREIGRVVARVLEITRGLQIEAQDVTAAFLRIEPRYRRSSTGQTADGVVASRTVVVTVRELDKVMKLLSAALDAGANILDPISLDSSRREALEQEALASAMRDAQDRADRIAAGFGVRRGTLLDVGTSFHTVTPQRQIEEIAVMASPSAPFEPGLMRIEQTVQATFAITAVP